MPRFRRKPTWAELRQHHVLTNINGEEYISLSQVKNYLNYLQSRYQCNVEIPQELEHKQNWNEVDFEKLRVPEILLESRSTGDDTIDIDAINSFK